MARPSLSEFGIANFRAIFELQGVPLRPITLLFGPNSSGKSSFLLGLQMAEALRRKGDDWFELFLNDQLEGVRKPEVGDRLAFLHDPEAALQFLCRFPVSALELTKESLARDIGLDKLPEAWVQILRHAVAETSVVGIAWWYHLLDPTRRSQEFPGVGHEDGALLLIGGSATEYEEAETIIGPRVLDALEPYFGDSPGHAAAFQEARATLAGGGERPKLGDSVWPFTNVPVERTLPVPGPGLFKYPHLSRNRRGELAESPVITKVWNNFALTFLLLKAAVIGAFDGQTKGMYVLGPLRSVPPRLGGSSDASEAGGDAWRRLVDEPVLRSEVGDWLARLAGEVGPLTPQLVIEGPEVPRSALPAKPLAESLQPVVQQFLSGYLSAATEDSTQLHPKASELDARVIASQWAERIRMTELGENRYTLKLLRGNSQRAVVIRDAGLGMSQLIPVVVGLLGNNGTIVTIEQPELHLHPAMQAEVGDLLIESALGRPQNLIIAETHSEHLLLRIMRRIRETSTGRNTRLDLPVKPDDVSLVFFEVVDGKPVVRHIPLDDRGMIARPWPGGFFEEGFREIFA